VISRFQVLAHQGLATREMFGICFQPSGLNKGLHRRDITERFRTIMKRLPTGCAGNWADRDNDTLAIHASDRVDRRIPAAYILTLFFNGPARRLNWKRALSGFSGETAQVPGFSV
jgi:hypothetical protein